MKRVLLLTEDFNEMTFLETLLKKLGFDTVGIQNPGQMEEKAMALNPDLIIVSDEVKGQSTHTVVETICKSRLNLKVILIRSDLKATSSHSPKHLEHSVKSPVDPVLLIEHLAAVANLNKENLLNKFYKLGLFSGTQSGKNSLITVRGKINTPSETRFIKRLQQTVDADERANRFSDAIENLSEPKTQGVAREVAIQVAQDYRKRSNDSEIKKIDQQRKSFVRALFKK